MFVESGQSVLRSFALVQVAFDDVLDHLHLGASDIDLVASLAIEWAPMVGTDSEKFSLVLAAVFSSPDLLLILTSKRMPAVVGVPALMLVDDLSVAAERCSATVG